MYSMKRCLVLTSLVVLLIQTGCVTGQRTFSVPVPSAPIGAVTRGPVYVNSVVDNRTFQNKPSEPSTPSVDGDVTTLSAAQKDRMIGRQRNGFGRAMGDIALANDDTVTKRVRALVVEGLRRKGYEISNDPAAPTSIDIVVDEFWAWMRPGFWALTFETQVTTSLTLKSSYGSDKMVIKGYGRNHGQVVKDGNWLEAFEPAFEQYLSNFSVELDRAGGPRSGAAAAEAKSDSELYAKLKELDELRRDKILTEEEFQAQKKKLLEKN